MSRSRTTLRATVGVAAAAAALLAAQAGPARATTPHDSTDPVITFNDFPETITPSTPTTFTVSLSNPENGTDHPNQDVTFDIANIAAISPDDVQLSYYNGSAYTPITLTNANSEDLTGTFGSAGFDVDPGYSATTTFQVTVTGTLRGGTVALAELNTVGAPLDSTTPTAEDLAFTQIPKATPYKVVQDVTLSRPSNGSLYYATKNTAGGGSPLQVQFGRAGDTRFSTDQDGSGTSYPALFRSSNHTFYIAEDGDQVSGSELSIPGDDSEAVQYGQPGDAPFSFSEDIPDDTTTPATDLGAADDLGLYRPSTHTFYLQGSTEGVAFGRAGDIPLVGNWDGSSDGDSIGVYRPSDETFYLVTDSGVTATRFGRSGDKPVVGDWDGKGDTLIGVHRGNTFILATSNTTGAAGAPFAFGQSTDIATTSSWTYTAADLLRSTDVDAQSSDARFAHERVAALRAAAARTPRFVKPLR